MENINDIISEPTFLARREAQKLERNLDPVTIMVVNRLFTCFEALCPGFDKQFKGQETKLKNQKIHFARAFMDEGINSIEQIDLGIKRCRKESPINIPTVGQFLRWCKPTPEDLGLISSDKALDYAYEILNNSIKDFSEPLLRETQMEFSDDQKKLLQYAIFKTGSHFMRNTAYEKVKIKFDRHYQDAMNDFLKGNFKSPITLLENKAQETHEIKRQEKVAKDYSGFTYEQSIIQIKRLLGLSPNDSWSEYVTNRRRMQKDY